LSESGLDKDHHGTVVPPENLFSGREGTVRDRARQGRSAIDKHYRMAILDGVLPAGEKLPSERLMCREFSASRATVRSALSSLEEAGLVERRLGSGTYVKAREVGHHVPPVFAIPIASPLDVIEARRVLEPGYVEYVAARATEEDFERMRRRLAELQAATDQVAFKKAGHAFQLEIARASRNPVIVAMQEMTTAARARAGWETLLMLNDTEDLRQATIADFTAIFEALRMRDSKLAADVSARMLSGMIQTILEAPLGA
jgi:DNA-binding FadR family transcriptional regulator